VLLLLAWAGLDAPRIAEALSLPQATVRTRLYRARQCLRQRLARTLEAEPHESQVHHL
jgi:DNA-directed RNA polymerase specialized sigma24 family protein